MTKKILLLAGMALALVAFAVPAVAQADIEFTNVPVSNAVFLHGEMTSDVGLSTGPGTVRMTLQEVEVSEGKVQEIHIWPIPPSTHIPTNVPGCAATAHAAKQGEVRLETSDIFNIDNFTFTYTYTGVNCKAFQVPPEVNIDGTLRGTATLETGCIFLGSPGNRLPIDDLFIEVNGTTIPTLPVDLTGEVCAEDGVVID